MTARVGLLLVGHVDPKSTHLAGDYPELFAALLREADVELVTYALDEGRFPSTVEECDGWICSPSRSSVYDDEPWIAPAEDLLRDIVARERPYVGICFGHQRLAQALGARVERYHDSWQVGVHDYDIVATAPWMHATPERVSLIASHQDQVREVPDGLTLFARAQDCSVAGFLVGERGFTIQPHPEFVPPLADHLLAGRIDLIGAERVAAARASLDRPLDATVVAGWIDRVVSPR
jgi:GMP synthase-like glutamine amidotransferase